MQTGTFGKEMGDELGAVARQDARDRSGSSMDSKKQREA